MRKKIYPVLFVAAALSLSACTEVLEPNVDYGGNTFINDYSSLVEAVNNLNKTLQERFSALNTLLEKNLADIKVAIDENTGAIQVLDQNTQQGLTNINASIFDGFKTVSDQVDAQGRAIVYAMNQNGDMLCLQIESTGKLISTQILESSNALVKAINDQTKSLEERIAALDATVKAGLMEVYVSIDKNTGAITLMDKNMQTSLATIDASLTKGFTALKQSIDEQGNAIVTAINTQGELLAAHMDSNGKLLSTSIIGSVSALINTLKDNNKALTDKIDALNKTVSYGLADVKGSINALTGKVELQTQAITKLDGTLASGMSDMKTGLDNINKTIGDGFVSVNQTVTNTGGKLVTAINTQGEKLKIAIDKNGKVISASIDLLNVSTNAQLALLLKYQGILSTRLADINASLGKLTDAEKETTEVLKKILENLNSQLATKGIYTASGKLYMTAAAWDLVSSDKTSELYTSAQAKARIVEPTLTVTIDNASHAQRGLVSIIASDKEALYAVNYGTVSGIETTDKVYEIVKMKGGLTGYKFTVSGNKKDWVGLVKYKVGYSYTDVLGSHSRNATNESETFTVTYVSDGKLMENIYVSITTK